MRRAVLVQLAVGVATAAFSGCVSTASAPRPATPTVIRVDLDIHVDFDFTIDIDVDSDAGPQPAPEPDPDTDTYTYDTFLGWSADGSYWGRTSAGRDGVARAVICRSPDANEETGTWPDELSPPGPSGCALLCARVDECPDVMEHADQMLDKADWGIRGPGGERVRVRGDGKHAHVTVECRGKVIAQKTFAFDGPVAAYDLLGINWRLDGGVVAVEIPTAPSPDYQLVVAPDPPSHLVVLAVPPVCRQGSQTSTN
jgi:hypothetical protein